MARVLKEQCVVEDDRVAGSKLIIKMSFINGMR